MADVDVDTQSLEMVTSTLAALQSMLAGGGEFSEDPGIGFPANRGQLMVIAGESLQEFERSRTLLDSRLSDLRMRAESIVADFPALDVEIARAVG